MAESRTVQDELLIWFRANGGYLHKSLEIVNDPFKGSSIRVRSDAAALHPGTKLISCPLQLSLSAFNARTLKAFPEDFLAKTSARDVAAFYLVLQRLASEGNTRAFVSPWHPYIASLPSITDLEARFGSPLWWDESEKAWLRGTNLGKGVDDLTDHLKASWEEGFERLRAGLSPDLCWNCIDLEQFTWERYKWAVSMLDSRSFSGDRLNIQTEGWKDGISILFPIVDLLNHHHHARVQWSMNPTSKSFDFIIHDFRDPGQEINNCYGPKSNEELLLGYGFCMPQNPFDRIALKARTAPLDALNHLGLDPANPAIWEAFSGSGYSLVRSPHFTDPNPPVSEKHSRACIQFWAYLADVQTCSIITSHRGFEASLSL